MKKAKKEGGFCHRYYRFLPDLYIIILINIDSKRSVSDHLVTGSSIRVIRHSLLKNEVFTPLTTQPFSKSHTVVAIGILQSIHRCLLFHHKPVNFSRPHPFFSFQLHSQVIWAQF